VKKRLVALALAASTAAGASERRAAYTIPMVPNHFDYVQIPCRVEGVSAELRCVIDTAALQTSISDKVVRPDKGDERTQIFGATSSADVPSRKVVFTVAGQKYRATCFLLRVDPRQEFDVLLGRDFLAAFSKVTLDFNRRTVTLEKEAT
jgi:hypothetical protein